MFPAGAKCFGSDIDPRVLRGQMYAGSADQSSDPTKRDIFENFNAYSLEKPELIRMDNHLLDRHFRIVGSSGVVNVGADASEACKRAVIPSPNSSVTASSGTSLQQNVLDGMFDVIVTDPPYGIRAGAKKSGISSLSNSASSQHPLNNYFGWYLVGLFAHFSYFL